MKKREGGKELIYSQLKTLDVLGFFLEGGGG